MRKNWLTAVMVIAYKYPYGHDETLVGEKIVGLLRIVIHTLAAQSHVCDRYLHAVLCYKEQLNYKEQVLKFWKI